MSLYRPERVWPRFVPRDEVVVTVFDRTLGQSEGRVTNLSLTGACIAGVGAVDSGARVLLRIRFPGEAEVFTVEARVVWARKTKGAEDYELGTRFDFGEEAQRRALARILGRPEFELDEAGAGDDAMPVGSFDEMMNELGEDLDRLGAHYKKRTSGT